jgi:hypothetical protein
MLRFNLRVGEATEVKKWGTKGSGFQIEKLKREVNYGKTTKIQDSGK